MYKDLYGFAQNPYAFPIGAAVAKFTGSWVVTPSAAIAESGPGTDTPQSKVAWKSRLVALTELKELYA